MEEFYFPRWFRDLGWTRVVRRMEECYGAWIERDRWPGVGLMGIQIMFARVIDRVSRFVVPRILFSIKSVFRLDDESDIHANEIIS